MVKIKKADFALKMSAIQHYLKGDTLEATARLFSVHRNTLWRWLRKYNKEGMIGLIASNIENRHWKRYPEHIEDQVIRLKESRPACTVREAQQLFGKKGIYISIKGIWSLWQRFGLTGFAREELSHSYQKYLNTVIPSDVLTGIKELIRNDQIKKAAAIINRLPVFPYNEIILTIPQHLLSLHKQVNRLRAEFGRIPLVSYCKKAMNLRRKLERNCLFYSSLWVTIAEGYALMWSGQPRKVLTLIKGVKRRMKKVHDSRLRFIFLLLEGQASGSLLRIDRALVCIDRCTVITRSARDPHFFMGGLGGMYSLIGRYREALKWTLRALRGASSSYREQLHVNLAQFYGTSGDYRRALISLKKGRMQEWGFHSRTDLIKAYAYLTKGDFQRASTFAVEALMQLKKEGVRTFLHPATLVLACCHRCGGEIERSKDMLKEILPLLRKYDLLHEFWQRRMILGDEEFPVEVLRMPSLRLAIFLQQARKSRRAKDYRHALDYARSQKLYGLFIRFIPFFHEMITALTESGWDPGLPKTYLEMPVFKIAVPVFAVNFLGNLQVQKPGRSLQYLHSSPKDTAFLIHLAENKNRRIPVEELYENFWPGTRHPSSNLSHLLTRLRKQLSLRVDQMKIRGGMLYWYVYFTTDYDLYKEHIAQAKVFERAGEIKFALRSYERAFRLFRSIPFKNMYDTWSENKRIVIMNRHESETKHYVQHYRGVSG